MAVSLLPIIMLISFLWFKYVINLSINSLDDIFEINLDEEEAIFRSAHRRICSLARHPILYYEETKDLTVCPLDGSKLIKREDDDADTVKIRMKKYREKTLPAVEHFKEEGIEVKEVAGKQTPVELHDEILKILE